RVVATPDQEEEALALAGFAYGLLIRCGVLHGLAVHFEDDVAAPESGLGRRPTGLDLRHDDAFERLVETQVLRELRRERLNRQPEVFVRAAGGGGQLLVLELADLDREVLCGLVANDLQLDGLADAGS